MIIRATTKYRATTNKYILNGYKLAFDTVKIAILDNEKEEKEAIEKGWKIYDFCLLPLLYSQADKLCRYVYDWTTQQFIVKQGEEIKKIEFTQF